MLKALGAFILSISIGVSLSFFSNSLGIVASISIIGAFLIYQNEQKNK